MSKHTSGPWRVEYNTIGKVLGVRTDNGYLCFLTKPQHYSGQDERYEQEMEEYKADAYLMAAAPEMREALVEAYDFLINMDSWGDQIDNELVEICRSVAKKIDLTLQESEEE